ncbi:helix-turn-helix domain-containing protein [Anabaena lutea]|uniref:ImmA/IrrE family metallo-endopeptidase n=1 Tax=Anabaena lutea FACHB-196 TaxID=2692881 RepID=A0ABR8FJ39_9NOST|nr:XRE family transcriptional regulator [Anabaena lutea]MBD2569880.1 ImmA/IrrE family metallo-endopeptidase [Anabaena lutea FACHB-196]
MKPSTPGFMGANLRRARKARNVTAVSLADKLGVTKQAISNYESGRQTPSPEITEKICEILNFPVSFFLQKSREIVVGETPHFYRSMSAATKSAREMAEEKFHWLLDFVTLTEMFIEFPSVKFPNINPPADPTKISDEYIEQASFQVRHYWGLGDGPISNSVWLLENNGAIIVRRSLEAETLDAFSLWVSGRPYIILGTDKNCAVRSRFDLAHELGHLILHRNISDIYLNNPKYFKLIEDQASRFAGAIQFPYTSFSKEVKKTNLEMFRLLKRRWKLSIAMMIKRAEHLDFLNEEKAQSLWRSYTRRGWRTNEPFDDELEIEIPKLIKNAVELLIKEGILSGADISNELNLHHLDIEDSAGLPIHFLNPQAGEVINLRHRFSQEPKDLFNGKPGEIVQFPSPSRLRK